MGVIDYELHARALALLFEDRMTVKIHEGTMMDETFQTVPQARVLCEDVPCRLSKGNISVSRRQNVQEVSGRERLYTPPEIEIPNGSSITVNKAGRVIQLHRSGEIMHYPSHNEVDVQRDEELV